MLWFMACAEVKSPAPIKNEARMFPWDGALAVRLVLNGPVDYHSRHSVVMELFTYISLSRQAICLWGRCGWWGLWLSVRISRAGEDSLTQSQIYHRYRMWISLDILYLGWPATRTGPLDHDLGRFRRSYSPDPVDALSLTSAPERLHRLDKTSVGSLRIPICKSYIVLII